MAGTIKYTVRTAQIGQAIVDLIAASSFGTACKVCQFGDAHRLAFVDRLDDYLPGVMVRPTFQTAEFDGVGGVMRIEESFRICVFRSLEDNTLGIYEQFASDLNSVAGAIVADPRLSALGGLGNDLIQHTRPTGITS